MELTKYCLGVVLLTATLCVGALASRHRPEAHTCRVLNSKFVDSQPWLEYPIVFNPIVRGRLTIWSGISSLPGSEFKCWAGNNGSSAIMLDFANFAEKLEWTYYDKNQGITSHGISVSHRENVVYKIHLDSRQAHDYMKCNRINNIEFARPSAGHLRDVRTTCKDCRGSTISLVNSQIVELLQSQLNENILDGLYWHLTQLISSQHFSGPISLEGDFN